MIIIGVFDGSLPARLVNAYCRTNLRFRAHCPFSFQLSQLNQGTRVSRREIRKPETPTSMLSRVIVPPANPWR
jgi:hypothetical protein